MLDNMINLRSKHEEEKDNSNQDEDSDDEKALMTTLIDSDLHQESEYDDLWVAIRATMTKIDHYIILMQDTIR